MRKDIHPNYVPCQVTCVTTGKTWEVMSMVPELRVDISNECHPFYTGEEKNLDAAGRIEKFNKRYKLAN